MFVIGLYVQINQFGMASRKITKKLNWIPCLFYSAKFKEKAHFRKLNLKYIVWLEHCYFDFVCGGIFYSQGSTRFNKWTQVCSGIMIVGIFFNQYQNNE